MNKPRGYVPTSHRGNFNRERSAVDTGHATTGANITRSGLQTQSKADFLEHTRAQADNLRIPSRQARKPLISRQLSLSIITLGVFL